MFSVLCELFWNNNKTKYSDDEIFSLAAKKVKKVPSSYTMSNVRRVRNQLNAGKVSKYGKPRKAIGVYNMEE